MAPEHNTLVLEILKQDKHLAMSIFHQREHAYTLRNYSRIAVSFIETENLCRELTAILNKRDNHGSLDYVSLENLKHMGQVLSDYLLTKTVKERLKNSSGADLILSLDEGLINIPWEILYLAGEFLCLKFNMGRVVRTEEKVSLPQYRSFSSRLKMLILVNPTNDLKSAYSEGIFIRNQFDRRRKEVSIHFKSTDIDTLYVKKNLRDYDIVHFAGHCELDMQNAEGSGWVLTDGKLNTNDIYAMGETASLPALIFSNACHSAVAPESSIDAEYQRRTYSLASAFLFSGVRHYIGTVRRIEDKVSLAFAKEFYSQIMDGRTVGEALRLGRLALVKEHGLDSIAWASYILYGDPNFALLSRKAEALAVKRKTAFPKKKKTVVMSLLGIALLSLGLLSYIWLPTLNPSTYFLYLRSKNLFLKGENAQALSLSYSIIHKEPLFLNVYPLLADIYQRMGDRDKALKYYFDYTLACEKKNERKKLTPAYIGIGWIYHLNGDYPKAFDFYTKALSLARGNKDKLHEAIALRKMAVWHIDKEDYYQALELLTKSSEINRQRQYLSEHRYNLACDYFDIGLVFSSKNDFLTAREFYVKSRQLFEKINLRSELSDYYFNLGETHLFEKEYSKALNYYLKGLQIDLATENKPNLVSDYTMLGELYMEIGELKKAEENFTAALSMCKDISMSSELGMVYYDLGLLYKKKGYRNKAREYLRKAQEIYVKIDTPQYQNIKKELLE